MSAWDREADSELSPAGSRPDRHKKADSNSESKPDSLDELHSDERDLVDSAENAPAVWPWALRLVTAFLLIDTVKRLYQALAPFWQGAEKPYLQAAVQGLWIATNLLVLVLFSLRARAGKLWLQVVFGIHASYQAYYIIHQEPLLWFAISEEDKARVFLTILIDLFLIHLLTRAEVEAVLDS